MYNTKLTAWKRNAVFNDNNFTRWQASSNKRQGKVHGRNTEIGSRIVALYLLD